MSKKTTNERESRVLAYDSEIRMTEAEGKRTLASTAPPWETLSVPMRFWDDDGPTTFREKFARGAFGDLTGRDIIASFQHSDSMLLGRTPGTLRLSDTAKGIEYEVDLADTTIGRDVAEHVKRGDVRGSSFEFIVKNNPNGDRGDSWEQQEDKTWIRTVHRAELFQVGPVTHPAYESGTDVALRSWKEQNAAPVKGETSNATTHGITIRIRNESGVDVPDAEPEPEPTPEPEPAGTPKLDRARRELALVEVEL